MRYRQVRFTLAELVERHGGACGGDPARTVSGFAPLETARDDELAFVTGARYLASAETSRASAILVTATDAARVPLLSGRLWVCENPYLWFARIAQDFESASLPPPEAGAHRTAVIADDADVDPTAVIGPQVAVGAGATIGPAVEIGAGCVIGEGVAIGAASRLHPRVTVYPGCRIGARAIVHSGAVIGADGFGYAQDGATWIRIPQIGRVLIGDDVEIGANTTIDRGALADTVIGDRVKLDNQIQIGHNVRVGDDTIMAAFVGIAGSAIIGRRCQIGGAARIMGHVGIADDVVVSTQTFVSRSIRKAGQYTGYYPMSEHAAFEKSAAVLRRLDLLRDRVRHLEAGIRPPAAGHSQSATLEPEGPA